MLGLSCRSLKLRRQDRPRCLPLNHFLAALFGTVDRVLYAPTMWTRRESPPLLEIDCRVVQWFIADGQRAQFVVALRKPSRLVEVTSPNEREHAIFFTLLTFMEIRWCGGSFVFAQPTRWPGKAGPPFLHFSRKLLEKRGSSSMFSVGFDGGLDQRPPSFV